MPFYISTLLTFHATPVKMCESPIPTPRSSPSLASLLSPYLPWRSEEGEEMGECEDNVEF